MNNLLLATAFAAGSALTFSLLGPVAAQAPISVAQVSEPEPDQVPGPPVDLTGTPQGDELLEDALLNTELSDRAEYQVLTNMPGDLDDAVWIVPDGQAVPVVEVAPDGLSYSAELEMEPPVIDDGDLPGQRRVNKAAAASLTGEEVEEPVNPSAPDCPDGAECRPTKELVWETNTCHARYDEKLAWMDRCSTWGKVKRDGDPSWDHWAFKQFATCKSIKGVVLKSCTLAQVKADNTITRYWEDWAPKSDKPVDQPCTQVSIGLSYFGVSVGGTFNGCEQVDITKYAEGARFKAQWNDGNTGNWVINSEREIAYRVAWKQNQGSRAALKTSWDVVGYPLGG